MEEDLSKKDFMFSAIKCAEEALSKEGMGFGAVIVKDNKIISFGSNSVNFSNDPTAHAEINAIRDASNKLGVNLNGCILYSTCEPCPMCFTAAWWANISKIIFGVSLEDVSSVSKEILLPVEFINEKGGGVIEIERGFMRDECMKLYK